MKRFNSYFSPFSLGSFGGFGLLFAFLSLVSCAGDSVVPPVGGVEIRLSPSVCVSSTRSPFDASGSSALAAHIYKSLSFGDYIGGGVYHEALSFPGGSSVGFSVPQYFPSDDSPVYLCGFSPADALWTDLVYSESSRVTSVNRTLDGRTDLLVCPQQSLNKSGAMESGAFRLSFAHLLTKLKVRAVADGSAPYSPSDVWGAITGVELLSVGGAVPATTVSLDLVSGGASYGREGASPSFPVYLMAGDDSYPTEDALFIGQWVAIPSEVSDIGYSLIAPFTPTGEDDLTLKVYTEYFPQGVEAVASLDSDEFTAGRTCVVTLTFSTGDKPIIQAASGISSWQSGADTGGVLD